MAESKANGKKNQLQGDWIFLNLLVGLFGSAKCGPLEEHRGFDTNFNSFALLFTYHHFCVKMLIARLKNIPRLF